MNVEQLDERKLMKAITLWQPWAILWACGIKEFETRGWATSYRGTIAIHAAQKDPHTIIQKLTLEIQQAIFESIYKHFGIQDGALLKMETGAVIATAELVGCHKMVLHGGRGISNNSSGWLETDRGIYEPSERELLFGDWTPSRYAWEIQNIKMLEKPIPAKGSQRLWNWEDKINV